MAQLVGRRILEIKRSGVRFPTLENMSRSLGQASHPTLPLSTQQRWVPGARIQGWIDMCWLRPCDSTVPGGKESAEHAFQVQQHYHWTKAAFTADRLYNTRQQTLSINPRFSFKCRVPSHNCYLYC